MLTTVTIKLRKVAVEHLQPRDLARNSKRSRPVRAGVTSTRSRRPVAGTHEAFYARKLAYAESF